MNERMLYILCAVSSLSSVSVVSDKLKRLPRENTILISYYYNMVSMSYYLSTLPFLLSLQYLIKSRWSISLTTLIKSKWCNNIYILCSLLLGNNDDGTGKRTAPLLQKIVAF